MKIQTILDQIDLDAIALPQFQRGYVWNRDQIRGLMHSLYRKYPVGSLMVWVADTARVNAKGDGKLAPGLIKLLVDGQQRITTVYGIARGKPPKFFDGNKDIFNGLHFHLGDESFEFYAPVKMKDNPLWINVTELMQKGMGGFVQQLIALPELQANVTAYINRLNAVGSIMQIDLHIEEVAGEDKTVDIVVDIFNRVNSGGTKLSKGDLALARICAAWPDARDEMKKRLGKWQNAGFYFQLDWLLRCANTTITGEAMFSALKDVDVITFQKGLGQTEKHVDSLINLIAARLGLDHDRVLGSRYSFPLLTRYLDQRGGKLGDFSERDKLLYWYIHTFLWGRYAGSTESVLNQDLALVEDTDGALDRLIGQLRQNRGDLRISPNDFATWSRSARFYPLLYMLTRVCHSRDWCTGVELSNHLLGFMSSLELHHVFPKDLLYKNRYSVSEVNALANFTFLTKDCNLRVSNQNPAEYLPEIARKQPGALESHWIPMDQELWKIGNYREFLAARRNLLAKAANDFLDSLLSGSVPEAEVTTSVLQRPAPTAPDRITSEEEERIILETFDWVVDQGLPEGELRYELTDPATGDLVAILDLAWPDGLQTGLSRPVALLIDESQDTKEAANRLDYLYFADAEAFKSYVRREVLASEPVAV